MIKAVDVCSTSGYTTNSTPGAMILPPIAGERHGAEVIDTFFFDGSTAVLRAGVRRGAVARERGLACAGGWLAPIGVVAGVTIDCFPDRYAALADAQPNQVILLTPGQDIRGHISAGPLADNSRTRALRVRLG